MITIKNVKNINSEISTFELDSKNDFFLDAEGKLTLLPALIDAHVHFRTPGHVYKEDWTSASLAALCGGVTTVCDMPNNNPACIDFESFENKKLLIEEQLKESDISLRYHLWIGATNSNIEEICQIKDQIIGLKLYLGSTTGNLIVDDKNSIERIFRICSDEDIIIAIHAEDNDIIKKQKIKYGDFSDASLHSKVRSKEAAIKATGYALNLAEKFGTKIFILHVSTKEELGLIREAKKKGIQVFAEASPHHLFLSEDDYKTLNSFAIVNPPLRSKRDAEALFEALLDGTIDTIGSDHAPHTIEEKRRTGSKAPAGVPGIETTLPLLLNAHHKNRISLEKIVELTSVNQNKILQIPKNKDVVLVDLEKRKAVKNENLKTKSAWSPFNGKVLQGWPLYTILKGRVYAISDL